MYHVAICKDEPCIAQEAEALVCRVLEARRLQRDTGYTVSRFSTPQALLEALEARDAPFHLLLLDIRLGEENGVELAARLRERGMTGSILYVTAYTEYMPQSFATRPLDYLLKPLDEGKLAAAIDWDFRRNYRPERVMLPVNGGWRVVPAGEILYAEATSHKSAVHLPGETLYVNLNFRDLLPRLGGECFCRCHNSILVNFNHVRKRTARGLLLEDGTELPVSRSRQEEVARRLVAFME